MTNEQEWKETQDWHEMLAKLLQAGEQPCRFGNHSVGIHDAKILFTADLVWREESKVELRKGYPYIDFDTGFWYQPQVQLIGVGMDYWLVIPEVYDSMNKAGVAALDYIESFQR